MEHIFESPCSRFFKVRPICDLFRAENVTGTIWGINFGHFEEADFQLSKFHTKLTEMSCIHFTVKHISYIYIYRYRLHTPRNRTNMCIPKNKALLGSIMGPILCITPAQLKIKNCMIPNRIIPSLKLT